MKKPLLNPASNLNKKDIVAGLGEIGKPILQLITRAVPAAGYDINQKLMNKKFTKLETSFLHICIPFSENFIDNVISLCKKFKPEIVVIHSTISPGTTSKLQSMLTIPVIYSATRGVHKRMLIDLKRYTKFYSIESSAPKKEWASSMYARLMKRAGVKTKRMSKPIALELAKVVVDTSYYGWLINYAQLSNMIATKYNVDYDEMWSFADEIHKFLGNRPKMFPGFIGGHCLDGNEIIFIKTNIGMRPITIKDYIENDYKNDVLSYDKEERKPFFDQVTAKWKRNFSGTMITITSRTNRSITTTDEHIMLVSDYLSESFAKNVRTNDYMPFVAQLPQLETKQSFDFDSKNWRFEYNMPKSITITEEFCRLLGYYVAEGSVSNCGKGYSIRFSFSKNETNYISDICKILKSLGINYYVTTQNNVTHIGTKSTPLSLFVADTLGCGRGAKTKSLPDFIYFVPRKMKEEFLSGYFRGDGSFSPAIGMVQAGTSSRLLASGLDILLLSMGYVMTLTKGIHTPSVIEGRTIKGELLYSLVSKKETPYNNLASIAGFAESQIARNHSKNLWHIINDNLYMIRTTKTVHQESEQEVYSIDTKNHLFVTTGGRLIHNCVIPNLDLIKDNTLNLIKEINNDYAKILRSRQLKRKKH
jgi:intein/homing endonuclease